MFSFFFFSFKIIKNYNSKTFFICFSLIDIILQVKTQTQKENILFIICLLSKEINKMRNIYPSQKELHINIKLPTEEISYKQMPVIHTKCSYKHKIWWLKYINKMRNNIWILFSVESSLFIKVVKKKKNTPQRSCVIDIAYINLKDMTFLKTLKKCILWIKMSLDG